MRRDLSISFKNVALMDEVVPVICEIVTKNPTVKSIVLSRNLLTHKAAAPLSDMLKETTNLEELDLSANSLGSEGLIVLSEGIKDHPHLTRLTLHRNKITDEGIVAFVDAFSHNSVAHGRPHMFPIIELEKNQISDAGCKAIASLLMQNELVESVYLSHNFIDSLLLPLIIQSLITPDI